jgi:hypothetical protein
MTTMKTITPNVAFATFNKAERAILKYQHYREKLIEQLAALDDHHFAIYLQLRLPEDGSSDA